MATTQCLNSGDEYVWVEASLLDIPFIFDLMMNGSELGAFSDSFMKGTGGFHLFWSIGRSIFAQSRSPKPFAKSADWHLISLKTKQLGFMKVETSYAPDGHAIKYIALFALDPKYRKQGHGTSVLKSFVDLQPKGTTMFVCCTKYAKAMQQVCKKLRFIRNAKARYGFEEYRLIKL